jgi:predicted esterase YcpF (UPF0227 family)
MGTWLRAHIQLFYPGTITRLVLINPAVRPYELFPEYLGPQVNEHTGEHWELTMGHVEALKTLETPELYYPEEILLMVQTGDEVLDYKQSITKYSGAATIIREGGNHEFQSFEKYLPTVFEFLAGRSIDHKKDTLFFK